MDCESCRFLTAERKFRFQRLLKMFPFLNAEDVERKIGGNVDDKDVI
jgi:hypothetical protein